MISPLSKEKAENCRDSLSMLLYSHLFDWCGTTSSISSSFPPQHRSTRLVSKINESLRDEAHAQSQPASAPSAASAKSGASSFFKNVASAVTSSFVAAPSTNNQLAVSSASPSLGTTKPPNAHSHAFIGRLLRLSFLLFQSSRMAYTWLWHNRHFGYLWIRVLRCQRLSTVLHQLR